MSHAVEEYYDVYDERRHKARKATTCSACRCAIDKGHFYTYVFLVFDGEPDRVRRCERCQAIHVHLREVGRSVDDGESYWPDERLACGIEYKKHWNVEPPAELAALAFWKPGEPIEAIPVPKGARPYDY